MRLRLSSSVSPALALTVGATVGLPLAIPTLWRAAPFYVSQGRVYLLHRPLSDPAVRMAAEARDRRPSRSRSGFMWIGVLVGLGTLSGAVAGFEDVPPSGKVLLVGVASVVSGGIAAVQWRSVAPRE
jgi:hypothetical protein